MYNNPDMRTSIWVDPSTLLTYTDTDITLEDWCQALANFNTSMNPLNWIFPSHVLTTSGTSFLHFFAYLSVKTFWTHPKDWADVSPNLPFLHQRVKNSAFQEDIFLQVECQDFRLWTTWERAPAWFVYTYGQRITMAKQYMNNRGMRISISIYPDTRICLTYSDFNLENWCLVSARFNIQIHEPFEF